MDQPITDQSNEMCVFLPNPDAKKHQKYQQILQVRLFVLLLLDDDVPST